MRVPFQYGRTVSGDDFINRKNEIKRLRSNFESGVNTILISPRRWGKSSLVRHVSNLLKAKKEIIICHIDLLAVRTEFEFLDLFAREIIKQTSSRWEEWGEAVKLFMKNAVPKVAFGTIDSQAELELTWAGRKPDPLSIYQMPEAIAQKKKVKIVVCIDEFQNIAFAKDPVSIQQQMRSVWQHHRSATYCLYGSKKHFLTEIFTNYSMPFYRFGDLMFLNKIEPSHWIKYIQEQFKKTGKEISSQLAEQLVLSVKLHPHYVQQLSQKIWIYTDNEATPSILQKSLEEFLNDLGIAFLRDVESLTGPQLNFLKAYLDGVREFSSRETLTAYSLGSSSNVVRIKEALENKEIMDFFNPDPEFVDPAFEIWLREVYFKKSS